jgi:hypothetical protein
VLIGSCLVALQWVGGSDPDPFLALLLRAAVAAMFRLITYGLPMLLVALPCAGAWVWVVRRLDAERRVARPAPESARS